MTSPFASHFGTNYCPKYEEVQEIQTLLIGPTLRLKRLGDEIANLQLVIDRLAEERDSLEAYVEAHRTLISPLRRLPLDIMQEIFIACLPDDHNCVMSASEVPVLLGRICSLWRAISLDTPRLWANLHIVEPAIPYGSTSTPLFEEKVAQRLETTKMWLDRSGQCPLTISLECAPENDMLPATQSTSVQFIAALIPFAARWQHIQFTILPSTLEMVSSLQIHVPVLETVAFHFQPYRSLHGFSWGSFGILRGARISGFSIPASIFLIGKFPLRWNRLTNLSIGGHPWTVGNGLTSEATLRTLSDCPELRYCKTMVNDVENVELPEHFVVQLPFLHTLDLHCVLNVAPVVSSLLKRLSLPELRNFTFFGYADSQSSSISLADFFTHPNRLESLAIDSKAFTKIALLESLRGLPPTVQRLAIHDRVNNGWGVPPTVSFDDEALEALTPSASCPALRHFSITHCSSVSDAGLLHFITAKMGEFPTTTLTQVDVQFDRHMTLDILPSLESYTDLDVSITHLPLPLSQFSPRQGLIHGLW